MARGVILKFFAIVLAAALLLTLLASGAAIIGLAASGLYVTAPETMYKQTLDSRLESMAHSILQRYLGDSLGKCPPLYLMERFDQYRSYPFNYFDYDKWFYVITDMQGNPLTYKEDNFPTDQATVYESVIKPDYPAVYETKYYTADGNTISSDSTEAPYWDEGWFHYADEAGQQHAVRIGWFNADEAYRVSVYLLPDGYQEEFGWAWDIVEQLWLYRYWLIGLCAGALLLFILLLIYLCCVAAKKRKSDEIRPAGLNRLPLDLYAGVVACAIVFFVWAGYELIVWNVDFFNPWWLLWLLVGIMAYTGCLLIVCFLIACAAQFKTPGGFWYRHSFIGWCVRLAILVLKKLWVLFCKGCTVLRGGILRLRERIPPVRKRVWEFLKALWITLCTAVTRLLKHCFGLLKKGARFLWHCLSRFAALLPLTWQWLLTAFGLILIMMVIVRSHSSAVVMLGLLAIIAIVLYGTHCFGTLLESTKRMSKGDLDTKVEDTLLLGSFKEYATHLNALADVAVEAARQQMKSERMKAELVTNVSHDIKTPLTSIINYVDLLQKAETEAETAEYLEVLDRQSQRLKKLIDDLMEMSKASTGNMAVELTAVDPVEAVNQALGEFSDKLIAAELTPIFQTPEESLRIMADGRLTWRVLSNLLSNAVKYALPGTRLYIDIARADHRILISLKNISREQLNVSSEELMERFVRGDASRNTEGSGLGLNIAQNLMELQKGKLELLVDGDLFKATLLFPEA